MSQSLSLAVVGWLLALLRFAPLLIIPAVTPFSWAPLHVRILLLFVLSVLLAGVAPLGSLPDGLFAATVSELLIGGCYGLAVMLPMAALGLSARVLDIQAGLASASLFNPSLQTNDTTLGSALSMVGTFAFFALGFHLLVVRSLIASARWLPLGAGARLPAAAALFAMLGSQFLLGLMVVMPVMIGLFAIDVFVAIASRSMPQANIYFLALPMKVAAVLVLLAASLKMAPTLMARLFRDALDGANAMVGG
ncbi:MAG TPA: flagellar biosynthetic protein FliR [Luteibacter sp.]|uniref:flagellar biosynthetic protein FliR n=1 Tax=Luteibacter sp. TaxID=1886636 RepID=UPI002CB6AF5D|nr:flagellar biosynthetic protein FliR [Luteibacter sp.]HVI55102.1 flagellar biosynthetic protein FliR [Luteibacter sp.]